MQMAGELATHVEEPLMTKTLIVVWGVPGAGKSTFARWLSNSKGFTHIETDVPVGTECDDAWRQTFSGKLKPEAFMNVIARHDHPVVLECGLYASPPAIKLLCGLKQLGADAWWFDGDRAAAFAAWRAENLYKGRKFNDEKWHEVVSVIDANWESIEQFFGHDRIVRTVESGPTHLLPETIY